jgi:DnaB-like helicase C terminal domain.
MEELILNGLLNYDCFVEFGVLLDSRAFQEANPKHAKIFQSIRYLFSVQQTPKDLSINEVEIAFYTYNAGLSAKEQALYKTLFTKIRAAGTVSKDQSRELLLALRTTNSIREAMLLANEVLNGRKRPEEFLEYTQGLLQVVQQDTPVPQDFMDMGLGSSVEDFHAGGLSWKLRTAQVMFGRLRKGDFGFIFARPDVGKTTFITDQCSYMAQQGDGLLIHFNNEEAGMKIRNRYYQSVLGITTKELIANHARNERLFNDKIQGRIQVVDEAHMHRRQIEAICQRHKPKLIVLDSIDKLWGFGEKGLRDDLHYKAIYQWARELSKEYGPVIGSCHASADGANTKWLTMENIAYAKTAKQGEADWILGIGASPKIEDRNIRYLSACKNKQMGDDDTIEKYRRGKIPVRFNAEIAQYDDYMEF